MSTTADRLADMPLPIALRLLAQQIKEGNGLRDNMERKHILLERAADALAQQQATQEAQEHLPVARIAGIEGRNIGLVWYVAMSDLAQRGIAVDALLYTQPPSPCTAKELSDAFERGRQIGMREVQPCQGNSGVACTRDGEHCSTYVECAAIGCKRSPTPPQEPSQPEAGGD